MKNSDNTLSKSMINISYLGISDDEITTHLIQIAESYLHSLDGLQGLSRKVPFLIAESFQNIVRHSTVSEIDANKNLKKDFFQIDFLTDSVLVCAVNWIKREEVEELNNQIDTINELNMEALRSLRINILTNGTISSKGGAGLGLIEMARKSGMPIKKKFVDLDDKMSKFFLAIRITKQTGSTDLDFDITRLEEQYNRSVDQNVLLKFNGHFNKETSFPLIEILERNLIDTNKMNSNVAENLTMIIEIIQNASKHGMELNDVREGTFSIYEIDNQLHLSCSNFVSSNEFDNFRKYLERIKSMNEGELKAERKRSMLEDTLNKQGDGGLGLIEIAIFSRNTFDYTFRKLPNSHYFYSIEIKLINNG